MKYIVVTDAGQYANAENGVISLSSETLMFFDAENAKVTKTNYCLTLLL